MFPCVSWPSLAPLSFSPHHYQDLIATPHSFILLLVTTTVLSQWLSFIVLGSFLAQWFMLLRVRDHPIIISPSHSHSTSSPPVPTTCPHNGRLAGACHLAVCHFSQPLSECLQPLSCGVRKGFALVSGNRSIGPHGCNFSSWLALRSWSRAPSSMSEWAIWLRQESTHLYLHLPPCNALSNLRGFKNSLYLILHKDHWINSLALQLYYRTYGEKETLLIITYGK